jgi:hypothetical protein
MAADRELITLEKTKTLDEIVRRTGGRRSRYSSRLGG